MAVRSGPGKDEGKDGCFTPDNRETEEP
jgi:hypothetical protein